jgi:HEAT repeat protein
MKNLRKRIFLGLIFTATVVASTSLMAAQKTEEQLIADLDNPNPDKVASTMLAIEKQYPTSTKTLPKIKSLLKDNRPKVRRKAARVLGALHAEVDQENLKDIVAIVKSNDPDEAMDGLKALRGLKAADVLPDVKACFENKTPNVVRDALRTTATLGKKSDIPSIEPLLKHLDPKVQKDAQDAIYALQNKT